MRTSESTKELIGALAQAQAEFPKIVKDAENPYFKSKYADMASIVNAVQDTLGKHGLAVVQHLETDSQSYYDQDGTIKGERLLLCVITRLEHTSGEFEESTLRVPLLDSKPQTLGSASTYTRRYALQSILRLAAEDDDGNASTLNENWGEKKRGQYIKDKTDRLQAEIDEARMTKPSAPFDPNKTERWPTRETAPKPSQGSKIRDQVEAYVKDKGDEPGAKARLKQQLEASLEDMGEAHAMEPEPKPQPKDPGLISDAQKAMIFTIAKKRGLGEADVFDILASYGMEHLSEIPKSRVSEFLDDLDPEFKYHHE